MYSRSLLCVRGWGVAGGGALLGSAPTFGSWERSHAIGVRLGTLHMPCQYADGSAPTLEALACPEPCGTTSRKFVSTSPRLKGFRMPRARVRRWRAPGSDARHRR